MLRTRRWSKASKLSKQQGGNGGGDTVRLSARGILRGVTYASRECRAVGSRISVRRPYVRVETRRTLRWQRDAISSQLQKPFGNEGIERRKPARWCETTKSARENRELHLDFRSHGGNVGMGVDAREQVVRRETGGGGATAAMSRRMTTAKRKKGRSEITPIRAAKKSSEGERRQEGGH